MCVFIRSNIWVPIGSDWVQVAAFCACLLVCERSLSQLNRTRDPSRGRFLISRDETEWQGCWRGGNLPRWLSCAFTVALSITAHGYRSSAHRCPEISWSCGVDWTPSSREIATLAYWYGGAQIVSAGASSYVPRQPTGTVWTQLRWWTTGNFHQCLFWFSAPSVRHLAGSPQSLPSHPKQLNTFAFP